MTTYDEDAAKPYEVIREGLKPPSSNWSDLRCPHCKAVSRAYWWSLAGGGKKCVGCGAKMNSWGQSLPVKKC